MKRTAKKWAKKGDTFYPTKGQMLDRIDELAKELGMSIGAAFDAMKKDPCNFTKTIAGSEIHSLVFLLGLK